MIRCVNSGILRTELKKSKKKKAKAKTLAYLCNYLIIDLIFLLVKTMGLLELSDLLSITYPCVQKLGIVTGEV